MHSSIPMSKYLINKPLAEDETRDTGELCCEWAGFISVDLSRDNLETALGASFISVKAA